MAIQQINQSQAQGTTLGYAQITSIFSTSSTTPVQVTGLSVTVTIPTGGRRIKITAWTSYLDNGTTSFITMSIWDGTVGSGTLLAEVQPEVFSSGARNYPASVMAVVTPSAGSKTYNVGLAASAGTGQVGAATSYPAFILAELI